MNTRGSSYFPIIRTTVVLVALCNFFPLRLRSERSCFEAVGALADIGRVVMGRMVRPENRCVCRCQGPRQNRSMHSVIWRSGRRVNRSNVYPSAYGECPVRQRHAIVGAVVEK